MNVVEISANTEYLCLRNCKSKYTSARGRCPACRHKGETLQLSLNGWLSCVNCPFQYSLHKLKAGSTYGCKGPLVWQAAANACNEQFKQTPTYGFLIKNYNIPTDPRAPLRKFFLDTFLGLSTPAAVRKSLRRVKIETVSVGGKPRPRHRERCLVVPLCEDLGKNAGLYLRGESGGECVIKRKGSKNLFGYLCRKPGNGFRLAKGFDYLLTKGSVMALAGKQYTLVFRPLEGKKKNERPNGQTTGRDCREP